MTGRIQTGTLYSAARIASGYKIVLKHRLQEPYFDSQGKPYTSYFTSYRHLDARSMVYLSLLARKVTGNEKATYEDLKGKYEFQAGEVIAFVGFSPQKTKAPLDEQGDVYHMGGYPQGHSKTIEIPLL